VPKLKVLLTGAAGGVGQGLLAAFQERYELRTFDRRSVPRDARAVRGSLEDYEAVRKACAGCEVVVHLAANADNQARYEDLVGPNLTGVANVLRAASETQVRRVVFASTCHTVLGYPREQAVEPDDLPRPDHIYGVTKVFGEALGRYYHDRHGLEFVAVRIGKFATHPPPKEHATVRSLWLSPRDLVQVFRLAVEKPGLGYAIVFGTSQTDPERFLLRQTRERLGYAPQDDVRAS
jgi:NAD+ dependent glucose-6-phosphate dehydrogenase